MSHLRNIFEGLSLIEEFHKHIKNSRFLFLISTCLIEIIESLNHSDNPENKTDKDNKILKCIDLNKSIRFLLDFRKNEKSFNKVLLKEIIKTINKHLHKDDIINKEMIIKFNMLISFIKSILQIKEGIEIINKSLKELEILIANNSFREDFVKSFINVNFEELKIFEKKFYKCTNIRNNILIFLGIIDDKDSFEENYENYVKYYETLEKFLENYILLCTESFNLIDVDACVETPLENQNIHKNDAHDETETFEEFNQNNKNGKKERNSYLNSNLKIERKRSLAKEFEKKESNSNLNDSIYSTPDDINDIDEIINSEETYNNELIIEKTRRINENQSLLENSKLLIQDISVKKPKSIKESLLAIKSRYKINNSSNNCSIKQCNCNFHKNLFLKLEEKISNQDSSHPSHLYNNQTIVKENLSLNIEVDIKLNTYELNNKENVNTINLKKNDKSLDKTFDLNMNVNVKETHENSEKLEKSKKSSLSKNLKDLKSKLSEENKLSVLKSIMK